MGTAHYLIDSNVITDYLAGSLPPDGMKFMHPVIDAVPKLSVITRIEIVGFNSPDADLIGDFVANSIVYDLTEAIVLLSMHRKFTTTLSSYTASSFAGIKILVSFSSERLKTLSINYATILSGH